MIPRDLGVLWERHYESLKFVFWIGRWGEEDVRGGMARTREKVTDWRRFSQGKVASGKRLLVNGCLAHWMESVRIDVREKELLQGLKPLGCRWLMWDLKVRPTKLRSAGGGWPSRLGASKG